ncbi:MAG: M48 family metalloprotease [Lachnospiraceae bacterium]|nr:M48 family metalloprotease [Lachnospiraceae bacterium]
MKKDAKEYRQKVHTIVKPILNLKSKEYEDARDASYLNTFKLSKGFDKLIKLYFEYGIERISTICYTGSNIRVTEENMPYVYECLVTVCETLDLKKIPALYIMQGDLNAFTIGAQDPIIVLNDDCIRKLNHEELLFILGHEVGHIKSEHCLYHSLGANIPIIGGIVGSLTFGLGELVMQGLMIAYYDWLRKSEFTADHAGLLACQDYEAAISVLAKLAGLPKAYYDSFDIQTFLTQAQEFEDMDSSLYNKILKIISAKGTTHPWTVLRAKELENWVNSGEYNRIINRTSKWLVEEEQRLTAKEEEEIKKAEELSVKLEQAEAETTKLRESAEMLKAEIDMATPDRRNAMIRQLNQMNNNIITAENKAKAAESALKKSREKIEELHNALIEIKETIDWEALKNEVQDDSASEMNAENAVYKEITALPLSEGNGNTSSEQ